MGTNHLSKKNLLYFPFEIGSMNRLIFGKYFFDRASDTSALSSSVRSFLFSGRLRNSTYGMIGPVGNERSYSKSSLFWLVIM